MWAAKMQFASSYIHDNQTNEIWSTDTCMKFFRMEDMQLTNIVCNTGVLPYYIDHCVTSNGKVNSM